jgi:hypothetical protein
MKLYRGTRNIAPLLLKLSTRWTWVINLGPWLYAWGKNPWYLFYGRLCGPRARLVIFENVWIVWLC